MDSYFPNVSERNRVSSFIKTFNGDLLLSEKVSDLDAAVLVVYMIANKEKNNSPSKKVVQQLFERLGRSGTSFSKAVYELVNRKKPPLLKETDGSIGLTFAGKEFVGKFLDGVDLNDRSI